MSPRIVSVGTHVTRVGSPDRGILPLSITTTHNPATDLGYLLHKRPDRVPMFGLAFGQAHVVYAEASPHRCTEPNLQRFRVSASLIDTMILVTKVVSIS